MRTIQEVCKIVGVTRRTLQEYNKIGLLSPSNINRKMYDQWYYSDADIQKLMLIQIYVSAGYQRKEIRQILDGKDFSAPAAIALVIELIQKKSDQLQQQADNLRLLEKIALRLQESKEEISFDYQILFQNRSFKDCLDSDCPIDTDMILSIAHSYPDLARFIQDNANAI